MYLRASNVSLHFRLDNQARIQADDSPDAVPHSQLGGAIETHGRRKFVRAIDDVSLDLQQGDRLAIVGHNGSGKSTLLKVLAGIYHPQRGVVESDRPVTGIFNIAMGFRQEASGYRNIMLKGLIAGKSRAQIERAIPEIVEFTELGPFLHMPIRTYSQGMAMRLAFSIATAFSSDILLMDEWIGAGDARFSEKIVRRMTGFVESAHILVLASHSGVLLRRVANRAIWLEAGRIREAGAVDEILDRYESEAKAAARAARSLDTSRKGAVSLTVTPAELPDFRPGDKAIAGEVSWDTSNSPTEAVEVFVVNLAGEEKLCRSGSNTGSFGTGAWIKPGISFRLKDADTGEVIANTTVLPLPNAADAALGMVAPSVTISPAELPDFRPGDKGVTGVVTWDVGGSLIEAVDLYVVNLAGEERLCCSGAGTGSFSARAWIKPGIGFRLKDTDTGDLLASATVLPLPQASTVELRTDPPSLNIDPAELPDFRPGDKGVTGVVTWDTGSSQSEAVDLYVVNLAGEEKLCCSGSSAGNYATRAWIKPGVGFRLKDADSGALLASATVLPLPQAVPVSTTPPDLTISPAELPDFRPGDKGVAATVTWDTGSSQAESADLYVVNLAGEEKLFRSGGSTGSFVTGAWVKPGIGFRLKDADSGALLASAMVPLLPQAAPVVRRATPPSLTITPAELPDFRPGDKGVVGEIAWDASGSGAQSVALYVLAADGGERLCYRGRNIGRYSTPPWIRPGIEFRLRAATTGELLAATEIKSVSASGVSANVDHGHRAKAFIGKEDS